MTDKVASAKPNTSFISENSSLSFLHPIISAANAATEYTADEIMSLTITGDASKIITAIPSAPEALLITDIPAAVVRTASPSAFPTIGIELESANLMLLAATVSAAAARLVWYESTAM